MNKVPSWQGAFEMRLFYNIIMKVTANNSPRFDKRTGTYFLDYYIPKWRWGEFDEKQTSFSQNLLRYKNNDDNKVWADYTVDLMNALAFIAEKRLHSASEIYMVAVPCSNPRKQSTMKKTIRNIAQLSDDGAVELFTGCRKRMIDASDLIIRQSFVQAAHLSTESRPGINEHMASMKVTRDPVRPNAGYVIMDDIVTRGTQISACNLLLRNAGVPKMYIERLVIGRTI